MLSISSSRPFGCRLNRSLRSQRWKHHGKKIPSNEYQTQGVGSSCTVPIYHSKICIKTMIWLVEFDNRGGVASSQEPHVGPTWGLDPAASWHGSQCTGTFRGAYMRVGPYSIYLCFILCTAVLYRDRHRLHACRDNAVCSLLIPTVLLSSCIRYGSFTIAMISHKICWETPATMKIHGPLDACYNCIKLKLRVGVICSKEAVMPIQKVPHVTRYTEENKWDGWIDGWMERWMVAIYILYTDLWIPLITCVRALNAVGSLP